MAFFSVGSVTKRVDRLTIHEGLDIHDHVRETGLVRTRSADKALCQWEGAEPVDSAGDRQAEFAALLRQHQTQLFGYIYSLVRDLDDADDLFQQTSLVLWDKFDQFDSVAELRRAGPAGWPGSRFPNFLAGAEPPPACISATSSAWP